MKMMTTIRAAILPAIVAIAMLSMVASTAGPCASYVDPTSTPVGTPVPRTELKWPTLVVEPTAGTAPG